MAKKDLTEFAAAIDFVMPACKDSALAVTNFLLMDGRYIMSYDGMVAIGYPIAEDMEAAPLGAKLKAAIGNSGKTYSITQLDNDRLSVKGGRSKLIVPCVPLETMPTVTPDPNVAPLSDIIKQGFSQIVHLAGVNASHVSLSGVLLRAGSMATTNRAVIIEFWHGHDLPPAMIVPREAAAMVAKTKLPLVGFGYGGTSATFWFENGAYIRTQLYNETFPDVDKALGYDISKCTMLDIPESFFDDVAMLEEFAEESKIFFRDGSIEAKSDAGDISSVEMEGMKESNNYALSQNILHVRHVMRQATFDMPAIYFYGENIRGAVARAKE